MMAPCDYPLLAFCLGSGFLEKNLLCPSLSENNFKKPSLILNPYWILLIFAPRVLAFDALEELCRRLIGRAGLYQPIVNLRVAALIAFLHGLRQIRRVVLYDGHLLFRGFCRHLYINFFA